MIAAKALSRHHHCGVPSIGGWQKLPVLYTSIACAFIRMLIMLIHRMHLRKLMKIEEENKNKRTQHTHTHYHIMYYTNSFWVQ